MDISEFIEKQYDNDNEFELEGVNDEALKEQQSSIWADIYNDVLNAADYGLPQTRHRTIIIAIASDKKFLFPKITHGKEDNLFETRY